MEISRLLPFVDNGLYGYINTAAHVQVGPKFRTASEYADGLAIVQKESCKPCILDGNGDWKASVDMRVWTVSKFSNMLLLVVDEKTGLVGFCDEFGQIVIHPKFFDAFDFDDIAANACQLNGGSTKWGRIDRDGNWLGDERYADIRPFHRSGQITGARLLDSECEVLVDKYGRRVNETQYIDVRQENENLIPVAFNAQEKSMGWLNRSGEVIVTSRFTDLGDSFENGMIAAKEEDKWGVVDSNGTWVLKAKYDHLVYSSRTRWAFGTHVKSRMTSDSEQLKYGLIDGKGKVIVEPIFALPPKFESGVARVWFHESDLKDTAQCDFAYVRTDGTFLWNKATDLRR